jgi:hypothetical protein
VEFPWYRCFLAHPVLCIPLEVPEILDTLGIPQPDYARTMNSPRLWIGLALVVVGLIWFGQGIGLIKGSAMTGVTLWAIVGPVLALAGIALVVTGLRRGGRR